MGSLSFCESCLGCEVGTFYKPKNTCFIPILYECLLLLIFFVRLN